MPTNEYLVVGAGFAGSVCARKLADAGYRVTVIDKRDHIGGNAWDVMDEHGVLIHPYGPHIFHTNSKEIVEFLSRFTDWRFYEHRVLAVIGSKMLPIPINRTTLNSLYDLKLENSTDVFGFIEAVKDRANNKEPAGNSEEHLLRTIGKDLTDKFFRGYTRKQWGLDLNELAASVAARIPFRTNDDDRYFTDTYQFMPADGYGRMFQSMLNSPRITVRLNTSYDDVTNKKNWKHTIFTGPVDEYFKHCFGKLPYRSLRFEHQHFDVGPFQPVGSVNYPDYAVPFTRITEFKHLTGQEKFSTSICREYPTADGDPYYPIPNPDNQALYRKYEELATGIKDVTFVGRLAQYKYYNMDQVVASALATIQPLL